MTQLTLQGRTFDIDAILFDKDGTLLNFGDLWIGWFDHYVAVINTMLPDAQQLSPATLYPRVGIDDSRLWDPTGPLTIGSLDDIAVILASALFDRHHLPWNDATRVTQQAQVTLAADMDWRTHLTPVTGLEGFLEKAREAGIRLGVVTSDNHASAMQQLTLLGLEQRFGAVLGHDQVVRGKPFPDMALKACQMLDVLPERTLIIGDSNGDMRMGKEAGLAGSIGICAAPHLDRRHLCDADCVIRDYCRLRFG